MDLTADEWTHNYDSPAWVRRHVADLRALDFDPPTSLARLSEWLDGHKGAVTEALNHADGAEGDT